MKGAEKHTPIEQPLCWSRLFQWNLLEETIRKLWMAILNK